jgi:uncharacterized membrane protein YraQ (UPF0718 family)
MSTALPPAPASPAVATEGRRTALAATLLLALAAVAGLTWAKWAPYAHRTGVVLDTHAYPGHDILAAAGRAHGAPSLSGAWDFTVAYGKAIWQALAVALVLAAGVEALLPRAGLLRVLGRGGRTATLRGGLCGLPAMMCTCCSAPITATLRRSGAPTSCTLAFWLANPLLNPAVLVFLAILLPWSFVATRVAVGAVVVFAATSWIARVAGDRRSPAVDGKATTPTPVPSAAADAIAPARPLPVRYLRSLARLSVTLVPEYLLVVLAVGLLRGWLFPLDDGAAHWTIAAVLVAAVAGTLVVIPTAGEIPILVALVAAGAGQGVLGALLITLPAISLPSMAMAGRALTWRVTATTAAVVCAAGLAGGALLWVLPG